MTRGVRSAAFWLIAAVCAAGLSAYVIMRMPDGRNRVETPDGADISKLTLGPHVLYSSTERQQYGRLSLALLSDPSGSRRTTELECDRIDFAGGTGVCLSPDPVLTTYAALVIDASFSVVHRIALEGIPSRVRVAPNGAVAAVTTFVAGHSYASGSFSTKTVLLDTRAGRVVADLESMKVVRKGRAFRAVDFNFWGVTFTPGSDGFFATLSTGSSFLLVSGRVGGDVLEVAGTGVECPSLSPDGSRIVYKKRVGGDGTWRLAIRPVSGGDEQLLEGEVRSVDDQVEWLDNRRILYALSDPDIGGAAANIWMLDVEGGAASRWLPGGVSPAVP